MGSFEKAVAGGGAGKVTPDVVVVVVVDVAVGSIEGGGTITGKLAAAGDGGKTWGVVLVGMADAPAGLELGAG